MPPPQPPPKNKSRVTEPEERYNARPDAPQDETVKVETTFEIPQKEEAVEPELGVEGAGAAIGQAAAAENALDEAAALAAAEKGAGVATPEGTEKAATAVPQAEDQAKEAGPAEKKGETKPEAPGTPRETEAKKAEEPKKPEDKTGAVGEPERPTAEEKPPATPPPIPNTKTTPKSAPQKLSPKERKRQAREERENAEWDRRLADANKQALSHYDQPAPLADRKAALINDLANQARGRTLPGSISDREAEEARRAALPSPQQTPSAAPETGEATPPQTEPEKTAGADETKTPSGEDGAEEQELGDEDLEEIEDLTDEAKEEPTDEDTATPEETKAEEPNAEEEPAIPLEDKDLEEIEDLTDEAKEEPPEEEKAATPEEEEKEWEDKEWEAREWDARIEAAKQKAEEDEWEQKEWDARIKAAKEGTALGQETPPGTSEDIASQLGKGEPEASGAAPSDSTQGGTPPQADAEKQKKLAAKMEAERQKKNQRRQGVNDALRPLAGLPLMIKNRKEIKKLKEELKKKEKELAEKQKELDKIKKERRNKIIRIIAEFISGAGALAGAWEAVQLLLKDYKRKIDKLKKEIRALHKDIEDLTIKIYNKQNVLNLESQKQMEERTGLPAGGGQEPEQEEGAAPTQPPQLAAPAQGAGGAPATAAGPTPPPAQNLGPASSSPQSGREPPRVAPQNLGGTVIDLNSRRKNKPTPSAGQTDMRKAA